MSFRERLLSGGFVKGLIAAVDRRLAKLAKKLFYRSNKVVGNKLFVMTYDNKFTCNVRYIVEELLSRNVDIDIVWAMNRKGTNRWQFPKEVRTVRRGKFEMFEEQASAKVWIDNALNCVWYDIPKKSNQIYINTWHGSLGIKQLSGDENWFKRAGECNGKTDYCITNSVFEEDVFRNTFWKSTPFLKLGHARNDILIDVEKRNKAREDVLSFYGIDPGKKIALYGPTFRDNNDVSCYKVDYRKLKHSLESRFGGEWVVIVRHHYKNRNRVNRINSNEGWLYDATEYLEMQELLATADVGITDYSSWAFDYMLTGKPVFVFATDIEEYNTDRGFYYPLETTPFPISTNNDELASAIKTFDEEKYQRDAKQFLEDKGCYETGHAAKDIADKILEMMNISEGEPNQE